MENKKEKYERVMQDVVYINNIIDEIDKAEYDYTKGNPEKSQQLLKQYDINTIYEYLHLQHLKHHAEKKELKQYTAKMKTQILNSEDPEKKKHYEQIMNWLNEERRQKEFNDAILKKC